MADLGSKGRKPLVRPEMTDTTMSMSPAEKSIVADLLGLVGGGLIIETGTYHGYTTAFLCELLEINQMQGHIVSFDLPHMIEEARKHNPQLVTYEAMGRLEFVGGRLPHTLRSWLTPHTQIELAILDADHHFAGLTAELNLVWSRLSVKGYIVCDDYHENHREVVAAVNRFARRKRAMFVALSQKDPVFANLGVLCRPRWKTTPWGENATYSLQMVRGFVRQTPVLRWTAKKVKQMVRRSRKLEGLPGP